MTTPADPGRDPTQALVRACADTLETVRARAPRVHCITNLAVTNFTANALLAAGATPSLSFAREEIAAFVASADGLLVNLGTLDADRRHAIGAGLEVCRDAGLPWTLDPVMVDRSPARLELAAELVSLGPDAIRANDAELAALAGAGVDLPANGVVARTGPVDRIAGPRGTLSIANGDPLMHRVTGVGCIGSALVTAFCAVQADAWIATAGALLTVGVAGGRAARDCPGPGTFAARLLDQIYALDAQSLMAEAMLSFAPGRNAINTEEAT